jgi:myo-inositol catabolism protein IolC
LGHGADAAQVKAWLTTAATVPGFIGFAVGRTTFWDALLEWKEGRLSRDAAVGDIARRYLSWVHIFESSAQLSANRRSRMVGEAEATA